MTPEETRTYNKAVQRLARKGIKGPTAQIIALEQEIDYYRNRIDQLRHDCVCCPIKTDFKKKTETKEPPKVQNAPNRYTRYDYDMERYVVPLLYKANGDTISFYIHKGVLEYSDHDNGQRTIIGGETDRVYGEVIDRLAELENKEEENR